MAEQMMKLRVLHNGDDTYLIWKPKERIDGCRGFALYRRRNGLEEIVKTWVGFEGDSSQPGERRSSADWPIQKFSWTDYMASPGDHVQYKVVPMVGPDKNSLRTDSARASDWSKEVVLAPQVQRDISCFFNRGIVAAQWVSRRLGLGTEKAKQGELTRAIKTVNDPLRNYLAGSLGERLFALLNKTAKERGHIYAALYELDDPQLIPLLKKFGKRAHVVLANGSVKRKGQDQNKESRGELAGKVDLHDRFISPRALGHNKFLVVCDKENNPNIVWTGSTNWTQTGLCTQANNAVLIENAKIALEFKKQWERLRNSGDDTPDELRDANSKPHRFPSQHISTTVWFTPTKDQVDLEDARKLIRSAKQGILFLMFNPGPQDTLLNAILERTEEKAVSRRLYINGALNQDPSTKKTNIELFHRGRRQLADFSVVLPEAIGKRMEFWVEEIKKKDRAFAMVHSKVVVVDPFGDHPTVLTGSHNLGPKASGKNDENLLILQDAPALAAAYAVNIMSIYNQYRWRFFRLRSKKSAAWQGLQDHDRWQDGYLKDDKERELDFWLGV